MNHSSISFRTRLRLTLAAIVSLDARYNGLNPPDVPAINRDNDHIAAIAVLPSAVTVDSMRTTRNMDAQGLPARWVAAISASILRSPMATPGKFIISPRPMMLGQVMASPVAIRSSISSSDSWLRILAGDHSRGGLMMVMSPP